VPSSGVLVGFVLASALLHAGWNALLRRHPRKDAAAVAVMSIAGAASTVVAAAWWIATARGPLPTWTAAVWTLAAGLCEAGYFAALTRGLTAGALGPVYTISRGGAVLAVWPLSIALLAEPVRALDLAGTGLLLAGLAASGLTRAVPRAAAGWALVTAGFIAGYHLSYKFALGAEAAPPAVFAIGMWVAVPVFAVVNRVSWRGGVEAVRAAPRSTVASGLVCATSFLVFLVALASAGAGWVLTLRNTSVVFAIGFAALLGERPGPRQLAGAALVAAGAGLMGAG
jgi:uncharacterized membrane protein